MATKVLGSFDDLPEGYPRAFAEAMVEADEIINREIKAIEEKFKVTLAVSVVIGDQSSICCENCQRLTRFVRFATGLDNPNTEIEMLMGAVRSVVEACGGIVILEKQTMEPIPSKDSMN